MEHLTNNCGLCDKPIVTKEYECFTTFTFTSDYLATDKSDLLLEHVMTIRAMFILAGYLGSDLTKVVKFEDVGMLCCEQCFLSNLEQIEDLYKGTEVWDTILKRRESYARVQSHRHAESDGTAHEVAYPRIMLSQSGGADSEGVGTRDPNGIEPVEPPHG